MTDTINRSNYSLFIELCEYGNVRGLEKLVLSDPNCYHDRGVKLACEMRHLEVLRFIHQTWSDEINSFDFGSVIPMCCCCGYDTVTAYILEHWSDKVDLGVLLETSSNYDERCIEVLLEKCQDLRLALTQSDPKAPILQLFQTIYSNRWYDVLGQIIAYTPKPVSHIIDSLRQYIKSFIEPFDPLNTKLDLAHDQVLEDINIYPLFEIAAKTGSIDLLVWFRNQDGWLFNPNWPERIIDEWNKQELIYELATFISVFANDLTVKFLESLYLYFSQMLDEHCLSRLSFYYFAPSDHPHGIEYAQQQESYANILGKLLIVAGDKIKSSHLELVLKIIPDRDVDKVFNKLDGRISEQVLSEIFRYITESMRNGHLLRSSITYAIKNGFETEVERYLNQRFPQICQRIGHSSYYTLAPTEDKINICFLLNTCFDCIEPRHLEALFSIKPDILYSIFDIAMLKDLVDNNMYAEGCDKAIAMLDHTHPETKKILSNWGKGIKAANG